MNSLLKLKRCRQCRKTSTFDISKTNTSFLIKFGYIHTLLSPIPFLIDMHFKSNAKTISQSIMVNMRITSPNFILTSSKYINHDVEYRRIRNRTFLNHSNAKFNFLQMHWTCYLMHKKNLNIHPYNISHFLSLSLSVRKTFQLSYLPYITISLSQNSQFPIYIVQNSNLTNGKFYVYVILCLATCPSSHPKAKTKV